MCNLDTEGVKHGCGHYIATRTLHKHDCGNQWCTHSARHILPCNDCRCDMYLGPDKTETIIHTTNDYCNYCQYWYRGEGSKRR